MKIIEDLIDAAVKLRAERFKDAARELGVECQVRKSEGGYEVVVDGNDAIERHIADDAWIDQAAMAGGSDPQ